MAMVGAVLPAPDAFRAFEQLDRDARAAKAAAADDPLDHLRCASFVHRLADFGVESDGAGGAGRAPVDLQVVMSLSGLLGLDSEPAWLHGYGVITRTTVQQLVAAGDVTLTRLFCDPLTAPSSGPTPRGTPRPTDCDLPSSAATAAAGCRSAGPGSDVWTTSERASTAASPTPVTCTVSTSCATSPGTIPAGASAATPAASCPGRPRPDTRTAHSRHPKSPMAPVHRPSPMMTSPSLPG
jgi:hypothetical protein